MYWNNRSASSQALPFSHALMIEPYVIVSSWLCHSRSVVNKLKATSHWRLLSQALIAALKVTTSGCNNKLSTSYRSNKAVSHWEAFPQALMAELYATTPAKDSFLASDNRDKASFQRLLFSQALIAALYKIMLGPDPNDPAAANTCLARASKAKACCPLAIFSIALIAALNVTTSGVKPLRGSWWNKKRATCHCSLLPEALMSEL